MPHKWRKSIDDTKKTPVPISTIMPLRFACCCGSLLLYSEDRAARDDGTRRDKAPDACSSGR